MKSRRPPHCLATHTQYDPCRLSINAKAQAIKLQKCKETTSNFNRQQCKTTLFFVLSVAGDNITYFDTKFAALKKPTAKFTLPSTNNDLC